MRIRPIRFSVLLAVFLVSTPRAHSATDLLKWEPDQRPQRGVGAIRQLGEALTRYHADHKSYPPNLEALVEADYLPEMPEEPWDGGWVYRLTDSGQFFSLSSSTHPDLRSVDSRSSESLLAETKSKSPFVRELAIMELYYCYPRDAAIRRRFLDLIKDPDPSVASTALTRINYRESPDPGLLARARELLNSKDRQLVVAAAGVLEIAKDDRLTTALLELSYSKDPARRAAAIEALSRLQGSGIAKRITQALTDESPEVRFQAAQVIQRFRYQVGREKSVLPKSLLSDPDLRMQLITATELGRQADPAGLDILLDDRVFDAPSCMYGVGEALLKCGDLAAPEIRQWFRRALNHPSQDIRLAVVRSFDRATVSSGPIRAEYIKRLSDPSRQVRLFVVQNLARMPGDDAVNPLLQLSHDSHWKLRQAVAFALGVSYETCGCPWHLGQNPWVARKNPVVVKRLVELADDRDPRVRRGAICSLIPYKAPEAMVAFRRGLDDLEDPPREAGTRTITAAYALYGLKEIGKQLPPDLWPKVFRLAAARPNDMVFIQHIMASLYEMPSDEVRRAWEAWLPQWEVLIKSPDPKERAAALHIITALPRTDLVGSAVSGLKDISSEVRVAAVQALGRLNGQTHTETLVNLMDDPDSAVAQAAGEAVRWRRHPLVEGAFLRRFNAGARDRMTLDALAYQETAAAAQALAKALNDPSPDVRDLVLNIFARQKKDLIRQAPQAVDRLYAIYEKPGPGQLNAFLCLLQLADNRAVGQAIDMLKGRTRWSESEITQVAEELARSTSGENQVLALRWLLDRNRGGGPWWLYGNALTRLRNDPKVKPILATLETPAR
jgi:HEAT repeat protein